MKNVRWLAPLLALVALIAVTAVWVGPSWARDSASRTDALPRVEGRSLALAQRDTQLAVWRTALAQDTGSALVLGQLAGLHLQRSREGGGWRDILDAERLARHSFARRSRNNGAAAATLAAALVAQHRFMAADSVARLLVEGAPDVPEYHAILGEIAMERGDDTLAAAEFSALRAWRSKPSIAPRLAAWHERRGEVAEARRLLTEVRDSAASRFDASLEVQAWYNLRLGEFERRASRPRRAAQAFAVGLALWPDDPRLLAAMTRLAASEQDAQGVVTWGERALVAGLDPEVLLLLANAYESTGDPVAARRSRLAFDVATADTLGAPFHRAWSLLLLDRGERVAEELARAEAALCERRDIYAYDLYAWALHRAGRDVEAAAAHLQARRLGTRDPLLQKHAESIAATRGAVTLSEAPRAVRQARP